MIKGVVLDVDGVLVGDTPGFNFPDPNKEVITALKKIHEKGISVVLCTGKGGFSIEKIVKDANLTGVHIADAGSIMIDPIEGKVVKTYPIQKETLKNITKVCIANTIYTEFYGIEKYYVQKNQENELTEKHTKVLQKPPILPENVEDVTQKEDIIKLLLIANGEDEKKKIENVLSPFQHEVTLFWTIHPSLLPHEFYVITSKGVSKKSAMQEIFEKIFYIPFSEVLGVGDTMGDWEFMDTCKFVGVMGNAPEKLKQLARGKDGGRFYIGPSVENNGILDIFSYFGLL